MPPAMAMRPRKRCNVLTHPARLFRVQSFDSFSVLDGAGAGTELHAYVQFPVAPDAYTRGGGLWSVDDDGSGYNNNTVLAGDSGDRVGLDASTSTVLLFQSAPAWTASQASASVAAFGITFAASVRVQSAAGGGAGIVWAVSPTTGGALQYYQLVLTPTSDGLNTGGSFVLSLVVNETITQVGGGKRTTHLPEIGCRNHTPSRCQVAPHPVSRFSRGLLSLFNGSARPRRFRSMEFLLPLLANLRQASCL